MAAPEIDSAVGIKVGGVTFNGGAVSGITTPLSVAQGGTGVSGDTYDADKVDGCDAGYQAGNVLKVHSVLNPGEMVLWNGTLMGIMTPGTSGYQLTSNGVASYLTWSAASDLIFSDTHCPKCGTEFQDGDNLILHVIRHNEVGDILTIPMHLSCVDKPKKTILLKQKVMEDTYIIDELTGELKIQRVAKTRDEVVTKHLLKEGYMIDNKSGKVYKLDKEGNAGKMSFLLSDVVETIEETISEIVYEDMEFEL